MKDRIFTTSQIARMLNMNPTTINKYVDGNLLRAFRTPGGHRRIREADFLRFLKDFSMPLPREITSGDRKLRIQLIDDDVEFMESLRENLLEFSPGIDVHCNDNSYSGLLDIPIVDPDLLILDYLMPNLDGIEFLERFREHEQFRSTDVVMVTGYPKPEVEEVVLELGAKAFFTKPLDMGEFCNFLRGQYEVIVEAGLFDRT